MHLKLGEVEVEIKPKNLIKVFEKNNSRLIDKMCIYKICQFLGADSFIKSDDLASPERSLSFVRIDVPKWSKSYLVSSGKSDQITPN